MSVDTNTGLVTYTSNAGFTGVDTFAYTVADDEGAASLRSNEATVTVTTTEFPVAVDDTTSTLEEVPVVIRVLDNDNDPDGTLDPTSVEIFSQPSNGSVQVNADGTVTYTPDAGFIGQDLFRYTVQDDVGATSNVANVTIDVSVNLTPFRNPRHRLDVNDDGSITPFDVLLIINHLTASAISCPRRLRRPSWTPRRWTT